MLWMTDSQSSSGMTKLRKPVYAFFLYNLYQVNSDQMPLTR